MSSPDDLEHNRTAYRHRPSPRKKGALVLVHRPERFWRHPFALLMVLVPMTVAADVLSAQTKIRCTGTDSGSPCRAESTSILWPNPREWIYEYPNRFRTSFPRRRVGNLGIVRCFYLLDYPKNVLLDAYPRFVTHEVPGPYEGCGDLDETGPSGFDVLGSPWRRAPVLVLLVLTGLVALVWAMRRTRITIDASGEVVRIERIRWPFATERSAFPRRELRWVAIEGTARGGVRLALGHSSNEYVPLPDFRPTPAAAAAERERLEMFLRE